MMTSNSPPHLPEKTIAIDCMGGDIGPKVTISGINLYLHEQRKHGLGNDTNFVLCGDENAIITELKNFPDIAKISEVCHAEKIITNDTKPVAAVRMGRKSNIGVAVSAVAEGKADAVVSAGNTGAYMAISKVILKTISGIERPALAKTLPTIRGASLILDLGANTECSPQHLVQFALMGSAFASQVMEINSPSVGILNIGSEELKGNPTVQDALNLIKNIPEINLYGFVEGNDICSGTADVIVTDGFSGNIALKSIEGTAMLLKHAMKRSLSSTFIRKLGCLVAKKGFDDLKSFMDPRMYNGAPFLGLTKIAVKSHGGADAFSFSKAVGIAAKMVDSHLTDKTEEQLHLLDNK